MIIFEGKTGLRDKAKRDYRLLLLDGHGSHVTPGFLDFCISHRTLLAVLPPHSSHRLQPLDVGMFKPLSSAYTAELNKLSHRSQGLVEVHKSDFLWLFWAVWTHAFTSDKIRSSFAATGVHPRNADAVLKHLKRSTPQHDMDIELGDHGDGDTVRQLSNFLDFAMSGCEKNKISAVKDAIASLQVNNEILHYENTNLRQVISTKNRPIRQKKTLELQQYKEYHTPAVAREKKKVEREKERKERAKELAARSAKKARDRAAATLQKARDKQSKPRRKASSSQKSKISKRGSDAGSQSGGVSASQGAQPPTKTTTRGRNIRLPKKFE
ncbi:pogo transposable [Pyrenophora seminiperda CCB06]|uniref:Pogo transposable n=1 Tax=Pyrenophora seminiperda CCB06 TaxID=1302712 RepID=A0A3M7M6E7_9PLEO|nr:pogo transposable [Pyrenophora seminiperda CCB06]